MGVVIASVVHRVGQLYDFHLNMWQFASSPQGLGVHPEAPKALTGAPLSEGVQQTVATEPEGGKLSLPQFVQPGVYRQLGGPTDEKLHVAAAPAATSVPPTVVAAGEQQQ